MSPSAHALHDRQGSASLVKPPISASPWAQATDSIPRAAARRSPRRAALNPIYAPALQKRSRKPACGLPADQPWAAECGPGRFWMAWGESAAAWSWPPLVAARPNVFTPQACRHRGPRSPDYGLSGRCWSAPTVKARRHGPLFWLSQGLRVGRRSSSISTYPAPLTGQPPAGVDRARGRLPSIPGGLQPSRPVAPRIEDD